MSRTLHFGTARDNSFADLKGRIDRHVMRRHTPAGYDRCMELAAQDYARHVAQQVSPKLAAPNYVTFSPTAPRFGKRS